MPVSVLPVRSRARSAGGFGHRSDGGGGVDRDSYGDFSDQGQGGQGMKLPLRRPWGCVWVWAQVVHDVTDDA